MDDRFSHWYPIIEETQLDFEGRAHTHDVFCEGHIVYQGRLMCGESREVLKNKNGAKKEKITKKREVATKLCETCLENWRNHPDSQYYRFTHATPVKVTSIEKNVVGASG